VEKTVKRVVRVDPENKDHKAVKVFKAKTLKETTANCLRFLKSSKSCETLYRI
jgi:hypothetical protein